MVEFQMEFVNVNFWNQPDESDLYLRFSYLKSQENFLKFKAESICVTAREPTENDTKNSSNESCVTWHWKVPVSWWRLMVI